MTPRRAVASMITTGALALVVVTGAATLAQADGSVGHPSRPAGPVAAAAAHHLPPWTREPMWAKSVHIVKGDQPIRVAPNRNAKRRGSAARDAKLPLFGSRRGPGCGRDWLHVGPQAWICNDEVEISGNASFAPGMRAQSVTADGLPFHYYFAGPDGSLAYGRLDDVDVGEPVMTLEKGFAVAIVEERRIGPDLFGRTYRDRWVPMRDFHHARAFTFRGAELQGAKNGLVPVAWVMGARAATYQKQGRSFVPSGRSMKRLERVEVLEVSKTFSGTYLRIDADRWVRRKDVRHPSLGQRPAELRSNEKWIDVELASQTLVAYEGDRPVFATLVSTGKGRTKGHPFETPKGNHRIWVKLLSTTMDNLENENANRYYRIEDVPYVQFFNKGVGLHGVFWHRRLGYVRSHGCVNLAPLDARRLFWWTGPHLPSGWTAALPTKYDHGTLVRVR